MKDTQLKVVPAVIRKDVAQYFSGKFLKPKIELNTSDTNGDGDFKTYIFQISLLPSC